MKVIIAEKPSLGRTIATAISKSQNTKALNNKGYITVGNRDLCIWTFADIAGYG